MHSSISLCASLRGAGTIAVILPWSSNSIASSGVSKSMAPRLPRAPASAWYSAYRLARCGSSAFGCAPFADAGSDSHAHTCVYVSRARECMTAG